jgi:hypothetical protein
MRAAAHLKEDTMSLSGSLASPADVFYVVQSTGAPGRREHRLVSVLYEMRPHAHTELARLSAVHPATTLSGKVRHTSNRPSGGMP